MADTSGLEVILICLSSYFPLHKPSIEPILSAIDITITDAPKQGRHSPPHILVGGNTVKQHNNKPKQVKV